MTTLLFYWLAFTFAADVAAKVVIVARQEMPELTPGIIAFQAALNLLTLVALWVWWPR